MGIIRTVSSKIRYSLQPNTWVLSCSDLHLATNRTGASEWVERELSRAIEEGGKNENAIVVLNGDIIEMWAGERPNVTKALAAHPHFSKALKDFAAVKTHKLYYVVGNHDAKLGWDKPNQKEITALGAELCFNLELTTSDGSILFEHGHSFDIDNAISDPRDPHDTPLGQHIVQQALPLVKESQGKLFNGIDHLAEPHMFPKFVASRVMYREILNRSWWLLIPIIITLLGRIIIGLGVYQFSGFPAQKITEILILTELAVFINIAFIVLVVILILQAILRRAKGLPGAGSGAHHNDAPRTRAKEEIEAGNLGVITGHTHRPEVTKIGQGFYANSGSGTKMLVAAKARFGLPKTYIAKNQLSWLELLYGKQLDVKLYNGLHVVGEQSRLERAMTRKRQAELPLDLHKHITIEL
jgi:UDP-2,3-diacylglucosamine pyrophosphatase LpxH